MNQNEGTEYYDVVVIGAGVGGLTAAALLSKSGLSVCVVEKESHPGGYLAGFKRKHFLFDTAIHWLNQFGPGGMVTRLFDFLGNDHPSGVSQKRIRRYVGKDFDYLLTDNPDELRDRLIAEFPHEKKGIKKFFARSRNIGLAMQHFQYVFRSEETKSFLEKWRGKLKLLRFAFPFIPFIFYEGEKGLKKGLNRFFKDPRIHRIFTSETELVGCMIPIGWAYHGDFQSPPKGGGQMIPHWLNHVIHTYGSLVRFRTTVTEVLTDKHICKGIRFKNGGREGEIQAKYVIAASDVEALYERLLPPEAIPAKLKAKLKAAELYSSSVTISLALDCTTEALGFNEELIHLADEGLPFSAYTSGDPLLTEISILAPSIRDPSLVPEGQGSLTIYMPASIEYEQHWRTSKDENGNYIRGEAYKALKQKIAETIITRVEEKLAPGLRAHILFYEVATPVTHYRYTLNRNGSMMGAKPGRANLKKNIAHYQTPVKNLLLGGHWAELGGGVPIAVKAGSNAALLVLKQENKAAFEAISAYMEGRKELDAIGNLDCFKPYSGTWMRPMTPAEKNGLVAGLPAT